MLSHFPASSEILSLLITELTQQDEPAEATSSQKLVGVSFVLPGVVLYTFNHSEAETGTLCDSHLGTVANTGFL